MATSSTDYLNSAIELVNWLEGKLDAGFELRDSVVELCYTERFDDAVQCARELYRLGMNKSNSYVQGVGAFMLGSVYFALGKRSNDWDRALEYYTQSTKFFHAQMDGQAEHNEGVAWMAVGRVQQAQCKRFFKNRWEEAFQAYQEAYRLWETKQDVLSIKAEAASRRANMEFTEWLTIQKYAQRISRQTPGRRPASTNTASTTPTAPQPPAPKTWRLPDDLTGALIISFVTFVLINLILGAILVSQPKYATEVFVGYMVIVIGVLLGTLSQARYYVAQNQAAIINRRRRILDLEGPGWHWHFPFLDHVEGRIPLTGRTARLYMPNYAAPDGYVLNTLVVSEYAIDDCQRVWASVGPEIHFVRFSGAVGIDLIEETNKNIDDKAKKILQETLVDVASDPQKRPILDEVSEREKKLLGEISAQSWDTGLAFSKVSIELYSQPQT